MFVSRHVRRPIRFVLGLALTFSVGAGCSSSSSSDPQSSDRCTTHCQKTLRANCEYDDVLTELCVSKCHDYDTFVELCGPEVEAYRTCLESLPVACVTGSSDFQVSPYIGCREETTALGACDACIPTPSDTACETCEIQKCCAEDEALSGEPTSPDWVYCRQSCDPEVPECPTACDDEFPLVRPKLEAIEACKAQSCTAEC